MAPELLRQTRSLTPPLAATRHLLKTRRKGYKIKSKQKQKHRLNRNPQKKLDTLHADTNRNGNTGLKRTAFSFLLDVLSSASSFRSLHKPKKMKQLVRQVISFVKSGKVSGMFFKRFGPIRGLLLISLECFRARTSVTVRRFIGSLLSANYETASLLSKCLLNNKTFRRLCHVLPTTKLFKSLSNFKMASVFWLHWITPYQRFIRTILRQNLFFGRHRNRRMLPKQGLKSVIRKFSYRHGRLMSTLQKLVKKCLSNFEILTINLRSVLPLTNYATGLASPLQSLIYFCQIAKSLISACQSGFGIRSRVVITKTLKYLISVMSQTFSQQGQNLNSSVLKCLMLILRKVLLPSLVTLSLGLSSSAFRFGVLASTATRSSLFVMLNIVLIPTVSRISKILMRAATCKLTRSVVFRVTRIVFKVVLPLLTSVSLAVLMSPSVRHVISWMAITLLSMPVHCAKSSHVRRALIIAMCGVISVSIPVMTYVGSQAICLLKERMPSTEIQRQDRPDTSSVVKGLSWMNVWNVSNFTDIVARVVRNTLVFPWDGTDLVAQETQNKESLQAAFYSFHSLPSLQQLLEPGTIIKLFTFIQDYVISSLKTLTTSNAFDKPFIDIMASGANIQIPSAIHHLIPPALWSILNYPRRLAYLREDEDSIDQDHSLVYTSIQNLVAAILKLLLMPRIQDLLFPALQGALSPAIEMISSPKMIRLVHPTKQFMKSPRVQKLLSPAMRVIETTGIHKLFDKVSLSIPKPDTLEDSSESTHTDEL